MGKDMYGATIYKIKAGRHTCWPRWPRLLFHSALRFTITFGKGCNYPPIQGENAHDINKAFGFTEGLTKANSARLGWRYVGNKVLLYPYVYCNGVNLGAKDPEPICSVNIGEIVTCSITPLRHDYEFRVNGRAGEFYARGPRCNKSQLRLLLYPYFGGQEVAPQDMQIHIKLE